MVGVSAPGSSPIDFYKRGNITRVETTPEMAAQLAESRRRSAQAERVQKDYEDAWAKKGSTNSGMQLGDVASQSPQQAADTLAAMTKLRDAYGDKGLAIQGARGAERTTSLNTYIAWLEERTGSAAASDKPAPLFNLKV